MSQRLTEVAMLFLKQGFTAFGGPVVHIAMMHDETVNRRKWLNDQDFLDLLGATNLIPGPNSTQMAIHLGFVRTGCSGLIVAGALTKIVLPFSLPLLFLTFLKIDAVAISNPLISRVRNSLWLSSFLDGVNVASLGLTAAVTSQLGRASLVDPICILIALVSIFLLIRFKVNSTWVSAGGAIVGILISIFQ
jgi:chromate transporter